MAKYLCINPAVRATIERIKKHASDNVTSLAVMQKLSEKGGPAPGGLNEDFTMTIPDDYCVTYTEEMQPGGIKCRHISISVSEINKLPNTKAAELIMEEFGFINKPNVAVTWAEKFGDGTQTAINFVEPISGNMNEFKEEVK